MSSLIKYEAACHALAEAKAVDEVKDIRDKADAMRIYAMQAKNKSLEIDAAEIRIRAERRLGEMIAAQKANEGLNSGRAGRSPIAVDSNDRDTRPTLSDVGVSKDLSSRAQKLAAVPSDEFEAEVGAWRERVQEEGRRVTTRLEQAGEKAMSGSKSPAKRDAQDALQAELTSLQEQLDEANATCAELAMDLEAAQINASEDKDDQVRTLIGRLHVAESQRDQYMEKCNQLIKQNRQLQRVIDKLEGGRRAA